MTDQSKGLFHRIFLAPESAWPAAIVRILLGTVLLGWTVSMMIDMSIFLSDDALGTLDLASKSWRPLGLTSEGSVWATLIVLAISAVAIIIGFRPTIFLVLSFLLVTAVHRRNPIVLNSGDLIMRDLLLLLALTPTSAALSVDRWRKHGRASLRTAPLIAPWGMRFLQLQMMVVYFFAAYAKSGELWSEGTALATALRLSDLQRFTPPHALIDSIPLVAVMTWGALAVELGLGLGLWNRRLRPFLIVGGVLLHLMIDAFMQVGFFGLAMISGLMMFLDGDAIQRRLDRRKNNAVDQSSEDDDLDEADELAEAASEDEERAADEATPAEDTKTAKEPATLTNA